MGSTNTPEESRNEAIQAMGEELGKIYHALSNELAWLYLKWNEYVVLYGTKPSRIDLMNRAAAGYFGSMEQIMREDILLHIARMTDRPGKGKNSNLTIHLLPALTRRDKNLHSRVNELIGIVKTKTEFAREWRHKRIAHRDLDRAISDKAVPLKSSSRAKIKEALNALSDVLNALNLSYSGSITGYEFIYNPSGSETLLRVLDDGVRFREELRERVMRGEIRSGDIIRNI